MARTGHVASLLSLVTLFASACSSSVQTGPQVPPVATSCGAPSTVATAIDAAGGRTTIPVQVAAGCQWVASTSPANSWAVLEGAAGSGPGAITVRVDPNRAFQSRSALIMVREQGSGVGREVQALVVGQRAATCLYTINPVHAEFGGFGTWDGSGDSPYQIDVRAEPAECQWTASADVPWIALARTADHGAGSGVVRFSVLPNSGGPSRDGVVTVAGLSGVNPVARLSVLQRGR